MDFVENWKYLFYRTPLRGCFWSTDLRESDLWETTSFSLWSVILKLDKISKNSKQRDTPDKTVILKTYRQVPIFQFSYYDSFKLFTFF